MRVARLDAEGADTAEEATGETVLASDAVSFAWSALWKMISDNDNKTKGEEHTTVPRQPPDGFWAYSRKGREHLSTQFADVTRPVVALKT